MESKTEREKRLIQREKRKLELERQKLLRDFEAQRTRYISQQRDRRLAQQREDRPAGARTRSDLELQITPLKAEVVPQRGRSDPTGVKDQTWVEPEEKKSDIAGILYPDTTDLEQMAASFSTDYGGVFEEIGPLKTDIERHRLSFETTEKTEREEDRQVQDMLDRLGERGADIEDSLPRSKESLRQTRQRFDNPNEYELPQSQWTERREFRRSSSPWELRENTQLKGDFAPNPKKVKKVKEGKFNDRTDGTESQEHVKQENDDDAYVDDRSAEKEVVERIQFLEMQDRMLDEQIEMRDKAEKELAEKLRYLQARDRQSRQEAQQRERLTVLKQEEERLERLLQQKIKRDKERDQRMALLYKQQIKLQEQIEKREAAYNPELSVHAGIQKNIGKEEAVVDVILKKEEEDDVRQNEESAVTMQPQESQQPLNIEQSDKEKELQRKEEYLKKLEQDLLKKESEISTKIQGVSLTEKTSEEPSKKTEVAHFVKPYVNPFSGTEPTPKNENTFEDWKVEIESLIKSQVYQEDYIVTQIIRNSLKGQARKVLITLGAKASSNDIIKKLENVYGNVASGESVLQEFYTASQKADESITTWGLRIEEILQRAIDKGHVTTEQKNEMLRTKFWRSLRNTELKNATRVYFEQIKEFELLRRKVRAEEYEIYTHKSTTEKEGERSTTNKQQEKKIETQVRPENPPVKDVQHQPIQIETGTAKALQDLSRRLEKIEKAITYRRYNPQPRRNFQDYKQKQQKSQAEQTTPKTEVKSAEKTEKKTTSLNK